MLVVRVRRLRCFGVLGRIRRESIEDTCRREDGEPERFKDIGELCVEYSPGLEIVWCGDRLPCWSCRVCEGRCFGKKMFKEGKTRLLFTNTHQSCFTNPDESGAHLRSHCLDKFGVILCHQI